MPSSPLMGTLRGLSSTTLLAFDASLNAVPGRRVGIRPLIYGVAGLLTVATYISDILFIHSLILIPYFSPPNS